MDPSIDLLLFQDKEIVLWEIRGVRTNFVLRCTSHEQSSHELPRECLCMLFKSGLEIVVISAQHNATGQSEVLKFDNSTASFEP